MGKISVVVCTVAVTAASAFAGTVVKNTTQSLYGTTYSATAWDVTSDVPTGTGEVFEPEGMTFHNGTLYVAGDGDEALNNLALYTPGAAGDLSSASSVNFPAGGQEWGAEGVTVNTSGAGLGAAAGNLVAVESGYTGSVGGVLTEEVAGVMDVNTGSVSNIQKPITPNSATVFNPDDIAYIPTLDVFAVINDNEDYGSFCSVDFYDHAATSLIPSSTMSSFAVKIVDIFNPQNTSGDAKGLVYVSESFAEMLTGLDVGPEGALITAHEATSEIIMWDFSGNIIGGRQSITATGVGPQDAVEFESIAVDEANKLIFLGDEENGMISVINVPEPASMLLVLGGLAGLLRRRG